MHSHSCSHLALNVTFGKPHYSFTEKDGTVNIQIQISTEVAQNFSVEVKKSKTAIKSYNIIFEFIKSGHSSFCILWSNI